MRALRREGLREVALPEGEVRVKVTLSGICNTDLELARGYMDFHGTLGHEFVGVTDDGTRVVGEINAGCGTCPLCVAGDSRHCPTRTVLGILNRDGAHADYLTLPARNLIRVPAHISDHQAVFTEPLAAACGVLERCPIAPGERVAVVGHGKLGRLVVLVLQAHGHAPVVIGRTSDAEPRSFDVVIEASGNEDGFARALDLLVPRGRLVMKSTFHGTTPMASARIVVDEITLIGSRCGRFAPALELLPAIDVTPLISDELSLDDGERALVEAAKPGVRKILLRR
ncbi:MAG: alcohol dehydrogenase catalytic domain-containing protein [Kofleriaceae bacterium]